MSFEPHSDDVLSVTNQALTPVANLTFRVSKLVQAFKQLNNNTYRTWYEEGIECEFLSASSSTGWQTGKVRIRFEFVPDVPEEPEPEPIDSTALAPFPEPPLFE
jgi:hypothetical protein